MLSVLYACLICINFNKYIHTLLKQIFVLIFCYRCIGFWIYQVGVKYYATANTLHTGLPYAAFKHIGFKETDCCVYMLFITIS